MRLRLKNTVSVLVATALTAAAVFATVQYGLGTMLPESSSAQVLTCPATGCRATSCHATQDGGRGRPGGSGF